MNAIGCLKIKRVMITIKNRSTAGGRSVCEVVRKCEKCGKAMMLDI